MADTMYELIGAKNEAIPSETERLAWTKEDSINHFVVSVGRCAGIFKKEGRETSHLFLASTLL
jgi:hypothetical protein